MLYEDDVVGAVVAHLRSEGWEIESTSLATQHGDDIVATRGDDRLLVEAKGEGSSKTHTKRYGSPFTNQQASVHVAVAVLRSLRVVAKGTGLAAIALPEVESHTREIERIAPALQQLGVQVFWVNRDLQVRAQW